MHKKSEQIKTNFYLLKHILQKFFGGLPTGAQAIWGQEALQCLEWEVGMPELHLAKRRVPCSARDQTQVDFMHLTTVSFPCPSKVHFILKGAVWDILSGAQGLYLAL